MLELDHKEDQLIEVINYSDILEEYNFAFQERDNWLSAGNFPTTGNWMIYLSIRVLDGAALLKSVLPVLKNLGIPFSVLRSNYTLNKANGYGFGLDGVGKFIVISPQTDAEASRLVSMLHPVSENFSGPEVKDALRLGKVIYATSSTAIKQKAIPFQIPSQFKVKRRKRIVGKYYVPVQLLRSLPKGDTIKAINLRKLKLNWCLIKQGKENASDDFFGRDMISRINWQYKVLMDLRGLDAVPKVLDLYVDENAAYLVLEYIEGITLRQKVQQLTLGKSWKELDKLTRQTILNYFLKAVDIVRQIHNNGYVHRDVTDENFIVSTKEELSLIDFELSWSLKRQCPNPPFGLGTFGYMSPQQHFFKTPSTSDDAYSLGAILSFLLTGVNPNELLQRRTEDVIQVLREHSNNALLSNLALQCVDPIPKQRPDLIEIQNQIKEQL